MKAASAIVCDEDWSKETARAVVQTTDAMEGVTPDLALIFTSPAYADSCETMLGEIQLDTRSPLLAGCNEHVAAHDHTVVRVMFAPRKSPRDSHASAV